MTSRGRGGKGLGRGAFLEQLGIQKGESLPEKSSVGPPSTYPPLEFPPDASIIKERNTQQEYKLLLKKEFRESMQNSEYYITLDAKKSDIERYSDRYQLLANRKKSLNFHWPRFPKELHSLPSKSVTKSKRKKTIVAPNVKKAKKDVNVDEKLNELEKKENLQLKEEPEDEESKEIIEELEEEEDEEMDEGTDYLNSYFDNGEEYVDDDEDGGDEGGVF